MQESSINDLKSPQTAFLHKYFIAKKNCFLTIIRSQFHQKNIQKSIGIYLIITHKKSSPEEELLASYY